MGVSCLEHIGRLKLKYNTYCGKLACKAPTLLQEKQVSKKWHA